MPSNKILEQKKQVVADLAEQIKNAQAGVLVKYEGIKVSEDTELRAALRKAGVEYSYEEHIDRQSVRHRRLRRYEAVP